jgi:LPXTG-motif cell wall-anchored protein
MKAVLALPMALLLALSVPALAKNDKGNQGNGNGNGNGGNVRGAPGPLVGAGLPVLLIGGGIYWIVRRRKKTKLGS